MIAYASLPKTHTLHLADYICSASDREAQQEGKATSTGHFCPSQEVLYLSPPRRRAIEAKAKVPAATEVTAGTRR